jgi:microcin C transport system permease protein
MNEAAAAAPARLVRGALSPLNQRRMIFRNHRRAGGRLDLHRAVRVSLFSEFIANDRPLLVRYEAGSFLVFVAYPETVRRRVRDRSDALGPCGQRLIEEHGWMIWPLILFGITHARRRPGRLLPGSAVGEPLARHGRSGSHVVGAVALRISHSVLFGSRAAFVIISTPPAPSRAISAAGRTSCSSASS